MKTQEDFAIFAKNNLIRKLIELENIRKNIVNHIWLITAIMLLSVFIGLIASARFPLLLILSLGIGIIISSLIYFIKIAGKLSNYKSYYKDKIIREIIKFIDPSLSYNPSAGIPQSEYMKSAIYTIKPDRYKTEDLISGKLGKTAIEMAEIHSEYKTETTDSKGRRQTQWHTIFKGVFFIADFNKDFKSRTVVLPDFAEKFLGFLGQKLQSLNFSRDQLIKMEDPEFEKLFVVYGTDQIEARYILSPALMQRMIELNKKFKIVSNATLSFSFVNSKLFIAIPCSRNLFEAPFFSRATDLKLPIQYFNFINLCAVIVEELDLNTRIWTKA